MKKRIVFTLLTLICAICFAIALSGCDHEHTLVYHEAKDATCIDDGNIAYYQCSECEKYYSDEDGYLGITWDEISIPAVGHFYIAGYCMRCGDHIDVNHEHELTHYEAKDATCTEDGYTDCYYCSSCERYFSDETAQTEIGESKAIISALGHKYESGVCTRCGEIDADYHEHTLTYTAAKSATCLEDGNRASYYCSLCGKYYADRDATKELGADTITLSKLGHDYECGNCTRCGEEDPSFTIGGETTQGLLYELSEDETYYTLYYIDLDTWQGGDIVIPESYNGLPVKAIDDWIFSSEDTITSVVIPASVEYIGESAFYGCINLEYIFVRSGNKNYKSISGNLYTADGTRLMAYALGKKDTSFTVPDGVTAIDEGVFANSLYLKQVTIPEGVETISRVLFWLDSALESVVIPASVTYIDGYAFGDCYNLKTIYYLGSSSQFANITVEDYEEVDDDNDYFINATVYYYRANQPYVLGNFWYYDGDSTIALWTTAATDGYTATDGLQYTLSGDGTYYTITGYTGTATDVYIPSSYNGIEVTAIGSNAFNNSAITSVTIPASVTSIGSGAFYVSALTSIVIPNSVTSIDTNAFAGCASLTSVTFGENSFLTTIGSGAFSSSALTSIVIPDSVTSIGSGAFTNCSSLTSVTFGENSSLTSVGQNAFSNAALKSIVIPDGVTSIGSGVFENCSSLTSVTFGENSSLTTIGSSVFKKSGLTSIVIPSSVTSINSDAFKGSALTSIVIPNSVKSIGSDMFSDCSSLTSVTFDENSSLTTIGSGVFKNSGLTSIVIPDSVTSIGSGAFSDCTSLDYIILPVSVTTISDSAFNKCYSLLSVYYLGTSGQYANISISSSNNGCLNSASVYYYSETSASGSWCYNADGTINLWNITLITDSFTASEGLEYTLSADGTYYIVSKYSGTATEVYIPSSYNGLPVKKIGDYTFYGYNQITKVTIGSEIAILGKYSFWGCNALESVVFGDSANASKLQYISDYAFYLDGTSYLTSFVLPTGVLGIGEKAFYGRSSITTVYFLGTTIDYFRNVAMKDDTDYLINASNVYYYSASKPSGSGSYWHYDSEGNVAVW